MKRPQVTDEMILAACRQVAPRVLGRAPTEDEVEDGAQSMARVYRYPMDGYEVAKALDSREYWDCTRDNVDELDALDMIVRRAKEAAEKEWFAANPVEPPLPVGTKTTRGVIAGIYAHQPAYYLVKEDGCTDKTRHLLIKFEDAREAA